MKKRQVKARIAKALRKNGFAAKGGKLVHRASGATITVTKPGKKAAPDRDVETTAVARTATDVTLERQKVVDRMATGGTQQSFGFDTTHGFLGEEFLTWLWWKWETDGGEFTLAGKRIVGVAIDDLLVFAPLHDDETQQTLRRGLVTRAPEARTALRQGHRLAKARLLIAEGSRQWVVTFDGELMVFGGAKLPEDGEEVENDTDRTGDRAANWLALHEVVSGLFGLFLRVRVGTAWVETEAPAMSAWMRS
jgi:hypothetical protein